MDIEQKKIEVKEDVARGPGNVIFARISICDEVQLADLMKVEFTPFFRGAANTSHSNSDPLPTVCEKLAQQRALLHGANPSTIMKFNFAPGTAYTSTGALTMPDLEDSAQGNKTTIPFIVLHDINDDGGQITLSTTTNANTTIADNDGVSAKYFTDFSKYFLTRSRANGELISVDENTSPYATPTSAEPFLPANTINGEIYRGTAVDPTANSDVRYDYSLVANSEPVAGGHVGAGYDLAEDHYTGNTYVWMEVSNVVGTFSASEELLDFANNTCTIKSSANTSTVLLETFDTEGTFVTGELLTDRATNAAIFSTEVGSNTEVNITLTGSTFDTGSNTDITLGFPISNTITLDSNSISRTGTTVTVETPNDHGILSGERIVLKGADAEFDEFNGVFEIGDITGNTLTFTTANTGSVTPTGDFSLVKNVVFGRTSNASAAVRARTVNASANVVFQSANLDVGFAIGNTVSGVTSGATGSIDSRNKKGDWYLSRDKEVKVFNSGTGTWTLDTAANTGNFWIKENEPVRISSITATSGTGSSTVAAKMILTKALATAGDATGGYDGTATTKLPGTYLAYPLKSWEDQTHDSVVTLEAYDNFANIIIAPEGLELDYVTWKPLGAGNDGTDLNQNGTVQTAAHNAEECTTLNKSEFQGKLGPYNTALTSPADDVFRSSNPDLRSSAKKTDATTAGNNYPSVNANPFFPSTGGTHKPIANTDSGITGRQPGGLDANAVFAGSYSEYSKGAVDPAGDYRFVIQNDQKWIYASNVYDANSAHSSFVEYNRPAATDHKDFMFNGSGKIAALIAASGETADNGKVSNGSTVMTIPADSAVTCDNVGHIGQTGTLYTTGTSNGRANMVMRTNQSCIGTGYSCVGASGTTQSACQDAGGTWTPSGVSTSGSPAEFACFFNRVQYIVTSNGGALTIGATTNMEPNFKILYQLVLDLTSAAYGASYVDPVQRTEAGSYSETGRSDASFKTVVETMKTRIEQLITSHNTERAAIISAMAGTGAHTINAGYKTVYDSMATYMTTFKNAVQYRISEISNRIGYVNGKDTAVGGVAVSGDVTVGSAGAGFTGYSFNGGNGYANTVYSHANFLAGKKIKLFGKILAAIADVDTIYEQIQSKRAEYYEYNQ